MKKVIAVLIILSLFTGAVGAAGRGDAAPPLRVQTGSRVLLRMSSEALSPRDAFSAAARPHTIVTQWFERVRISRRRSSPLWVRKLKYWAIGLVTLGITGPLAQAAEIVKKVTFDPARHIMTITDQVRIGHHENTNLIKLARQLHLGHWKEALYKPNSGRIDGHTFRIFKDQLLDVAGTSHSYSVPGPPKVANIIVEPTDFLSRVVHIFNSLIHPTTWDIHTLLFIAATGLTVGLAIYIFKTRKIWKRVLAGALIPVMLLINLLPFGGEHHPQPTPVAATHDMVPQATEVSPPPPPSVVKHRPVWRRAPLPKGTVDIEPVHSMSGNPLMETFPLEELPSIAISLEARQYADQLLAESAQNAARNVLEDLELEAAAAQTPPTPRVTVTAGFQSSTQFVTGKPNVNRLGPALDGNVIPKTGGPSKKTTLALRETERKLREAEAGVVAASKKRELAQAIVSWVEARNGDDDSVTEDARLHLIELAPDANMALLATLSDEDLTSLRSVTHDDGSLSRAKESALKVARSLLGVQADSERGWKLILRWYLGFNVLNPTTNVLNLARWGVQIPEVGLAPKINWRTQTRRLTRELKRHQSEAAAADDPAAFRQAMADLLPWVEQLERELDHKTIHNAKERDRQKAYRETLAALRTLAAGGDPVYPSADTTTPALHRKWFEIKTATRVSSHGSDTISTLDESNNVTKNIKNQTAGETAAVTIDLSRPEPKTGNEQVDRALELQRHVDSPKIFAFDLAQMFSLDNPEGPGTYSRTILSLDVSPWIKTGVEHFIHLFVHSGESRAREARRLLADAAVRQTTLAAKLSNDKSLSPLERADLGVQLAESRLEVARRLAPYGSRWIDLSFLLYKVINSAPGKKEFEVWTETRGLVVTAVFNPAGKLDEKATVDHQIDFARNDLATAEQNRMSAQAAVDRQRWTTAGEKASGLLAQLSSQPGSRIETQPVTWTFNLVQSANVPSTIDAIVKARFASAPPPRGAGVLRRFNPVTTAMAFFGDATKDRLTARGVAVKAGQVTLIGGTAKAAGKASAAEKRLEARRLDEEKHTLGLRLQSLFDRVSGLHRQALIEEAAYNAALKNWRKNQKTPDTDSAARLTTAIQRFYGVMGRLDEANKNLSAELEGVDTANLGLVAFRFNIGIDELTSTTTARRFNFTFPISTRFTPWQFRFRRNLQRAA